MPLADAGVTSRRCAIAVIVDRALALLQRVDRLRVVLYGGRELCFTGSHRSDYGTPNFGFKSAKTESATAHSATLAPAAISSS